MKDGCRLTEYLALVFKGICMGGADIVPGISGGTIALIFGIYRKFIDALKSLNVWFLIYGVLSLFDPKYKKKAKDAYSRIDFGFLLPLVLGILIAMVIFSHVLEYMFFEHEALTYAFFLGLIVASSILVFKRTKLPLNLLSMGAFLVGMVVSVLIVGLHEIQVVHSVLVIFISGMISFCAMTLPGLSGAFLLLILGQYEFLLGAFNKFLHGDLNGLPFIFAFVLGGLLSLVVFSRFLSHMLHNHKVATLAFVIGLMVGALRKPAMVINESSVSPFSLAIGAIVGVVVIGLLAFIEQRMDASQMDEEL